MTERIKNASKDALNAAYLAARTGTRDELRTIQDWLHLNYDILTEAIDDRTYNDTAAVVESRIGVAGVHALSQLVTDEIWSHEDWANAAESAGTLLRLHALAFPDAIARPLAEVLAPYTARIESRFERNQARQAERNESIRRAVHAAIAASSSARDLTVIQQDALGADICLAVIKAVRQHS